MDHSNTIKNICNLINLIPESCKDSSSINLIQGLCGNIVNQLKTINMKRKKDSEETEDEEDEKIVKKKRKHNVKLNFKPMKQEIIYYENEECRFGIKIRFVVKENNEYEMILFLTTLRDLSHHSLSNYDMLKTSKMNEFPRTCYHKYLRPQSYITFEQFHEIYSTNELLNSKEKFTPLYEFLKDLQRTIESIEDKMNLTAIDFTESTFKEVFMIHDKFKLL